VRTLVVIDDEESIRSAIVRGFPDYDVGEAATAAAGLALVGSLAPDVVLLDLKLGEASGLDLLPCLAALPHAPAVVVITAFGTVRSTVEALRRGAYDYVEKPFDLDTLRMSIEKAIGYRGLRDEVAFLRARVAGLAGEGGPLLGGDPEIEKVRGLIPRLAADACPVLVLGASGTGKELVARALHGAGPRAQRPFVVVNCAALPEGLVESELFGHEKGAFTGACTRVRGRFERAEDGTLFLDEIGDLPPGFQAKLLRVLEDGGFERVGGDRTLQCRARVIAATNRDLDAARAAGRFRDDLYFRLSAVVLSLPPLARRRGDILTLAGTFLAGHRERRGGGPVRLGREAAGVLLAYPWPGNVRELKNAMDRASLLAEGDEVELIDLPAAVALAAEGEGPPRDPEDREGSLRERVEAFEAEAIRAALGRLGESRTRTARALGISIRALQYKLRRFGIS
jgi:DNA-binding NtrC family response regulator